jgi:hypothetical protein
MSYGKSICLVLVIESWQKISHRQNVANTGECTVDESLFGTAVSAILDVDIPLEQHVIVSIRRMDIISVLLGQSIASKAIKQQEGIQMYNV